MADKKNKTDKDNKKEIDMDNFDFESLDPKKKKNVDTPSEEEVTEKHKKDDNGVCRDTDGKFAESYFCVNEIQATIYSGEPFTEHVIVNNKGQILVGKEGKKHTQTGYLAIEREGLETYLEKVTNKVTVLDKQIGLNLNAREQYEKNVSELEEQLKGLQIKYDANQKMLEDIQKEGLDAEAYAKAQEEISALKKESQDILDSLEESGYVKLDEDEVNIIPIEEHEEYKTLEKQLKEKETKINALQTMNEALQKMQNKYSEKDVSDEEIKDYVEDKLKETADTMNHLEKEIINKFSEDLLEAMDLHDDLTESNYIEELEAELKEKSKLSVEGYKLMELESKISYITQEKNGKQAVVNHPKPGVPYNMMVLVDFNDDSFEDVMAYVEVDIENDDGTMIRRTLSVESYSKAKVKDLENPKIMLSDKKEPLYFARDAPVEAGVYAFVKKYKQDDKEIEE